jgi:hypothetical protein
MNYDPSYYVQLIGKKKIKQSISLIIVIYWEGKQNKQKKK